MKSPHTQKRLRALPQVGRLLESAELQELAQRYSHDLVKQFCQEVLEQARQLILNDGENVPDAAELIRAVHTRLEGFLQPRLKRVINATGILLHTGLGRAPLLEEVYARAFERVKGACNLELDLESGKRGDRQNHLNELLRTLTGAESSAVVNNNAAAVLLALNTLDFPISVMNYILGGGGFSSRLMKVIRAEKGLTYGINSYFDARLQPGPFKIGTFTKNESTLEAIQETIKQVKKFQEEGPTEKELEDAKSYFTGSYPLGFEEPKQIAGQLQSVELFGLGKDYITTYRSRVNAVTAEDVKRVARQYLHPDDMDFVVVSKVDAVKDQLEKLGTVEVLEIK